MRVIATATGFDNLAIREPGDIFEMPDDAKAHWFEPVEEKKVDTKKAAASKDLA